MKWTTAEREALKLEYKQRRHLSRPGSPWAPGMDDRFIEMWFDDVGVTEIGRRLGVSKNSVVGRRKRVGLPQRNSTPLPDGQRKRRAPRPPAAPRIGAQSLPPLASVAIVLPAPEAATPIFQAPEEEPMPKAARMPVPTPEKPVQRVRPCAWPTNAGRPWTFCEAPSLPGRVYCAHHHRIGTAQVRERHEDEAA